MTAYDDGFEITTEISPFWFLDVILVRLGDYRVFLSQIAILCLIW